MHVRVRVWNMEEINRKCQHCVCRHLNECVVVSISATRLGKMLGCEGDER